MPHAVAQSWRRRSSTSRSGVSATSSPPTWRKHHCPSSDSEVNLSTVYRANSAIVLEPLVWNTRPGAWDVEPPVAKRRPWSTTVTSAQPRSTSSSASEQPTMPAPMITTRGEAAMALLGRWTARPPIGDRRPRWLRFGWARSVAGRPGHPGLPGVGMGVDPRLGGVFGRHVLVGDRVGDLVLVLVRPAERLDQVVGLAAVGRELRGHDLVQGVRRVVAVHELRIGVAALGPLGQVDLVQLDLVEEPLRVVEVAQEGRLVLRCLLVRGDGGGLAAGVDHLVVQLEVGDERLVVGDERRVAREELALVTRLGRLEEVRVLVQVVPVEDVGVVGDHPVRDVPADDPGHAVRTRVLGDLLVRDVRLLEIRVAPVLEDDVDLAGIEALPGDLLGEGVRLDLVAHLLEQALDHGDIRLGADPLVDHQLDGALIAGARAGRRGRGRAAAGRRSGSAGTAARARARPTARAGVRPAARPAARATGCQEDGHDRAPRDQPTHPCVVHSSLLQDLPDQPALMMVERRRPPAPWVIRSSMMPSRTIAVPAARPLPKSSPWANPATTS